MQVRLRPVRVAFSIRFVIFLEVWNEIFVCAQVNNVSEARLQMDFGLAGMDMHTRGR